MKTKISLVIVLLSLCLRTIGQEKHYIETSVSDTIRLKALQIKYEVSTSEISNPYDYDYQQTAKDSAKTMSLEKIELLLKREKYNYSIGDINSYTIVKGRQSAPSLIITLKSKSDLERLIKKLDTLKGISGKISSVDYEPESNYSEQMFKRLYAKALSEVKMLAKVTGNEPGNLISASEVNDMYSDYMDTLIGFSKNSAFDIFGSYSTLYKIYKRKFTFRFELK